MRARPVLISSGVGWVIVVVGDIAVVFVLELNLDVDVAVERDRGLVMTAWTVASSLPLSP